jgi:hypothetical protein
MKKKRKESHFSKNFSLSKEVMLNLPGTFKVLGEHSLLQ